MSDRERELAQIEAERDALRVALKLAEHDLAVAAVWITEPDRHLKIKQARERAAAALSPRDGSDK